MAEQSNKSTSITRPTSVTLLALGVLLIAFLNLIRLVQSLVLWDFLGEIFPTIGLYRFIPFYLVFTGLIWGSIGLVLTWGLWRGSRWVSLFTGLTALVYSIYYWIDRLWISASHGQSNWSFSVGLNIFGLCYVLWTLFYSKARLFFRRNA
jgi:hypothetical protein